MLKRGLKNLNVIFKLAIHLRIHIIQTVCVVYWIWVKKPCSELHPSLLFSPKQLIDFILCFLLKNLNIMLIWNFLSLSPAQTTQYAIHCIYKNRQHIRVNTENILLLRTFICFYHQLPHLFCINCTHLPLVVSEQVTQTAANSAKMDVLPSL